MFPGIKGKFVIKAFIFLTFDQSLRKFVDNGKEKHNSIFPI